MKKFLSAALVFVLIFSLTACSGGSGDPNDSPNGATVTPATSSEATPTTASSELSDEPVTLKIVGCSAFSASGPDGTVDAITGLEMPGYNQIVEAWNELHPNVTLEIEAYPWDNWQAAIQTAVLAGNVDVIMHGATLTDLVTPLDDRIASDPDFNSKRLAYSKRRSEALGSLEDIYITGVPVTVAPMVVMLNKEILDDYGVALPTDGWTWDDLLEIAKKTTGTNPKTGEQTYGFQFHNSHSDNEIWKNFANLGYGLGTTPTIQYGETAKASVMNYSDDNAMKIWNFIDELSQYTSPADREGIDPSKPEANLDIAIYFSEAAVGSYKQLNAAGVLDKYYVINLPTVNSGELKGSVTPYCGDSNLAICKTSENKDWAWEFIKFSVTNEDAIDYYIANGGVVNNTEEYSKLDETINQEWIDAIGRAMSKVPDTYSPGSGLYSNNISFGNLNASIGAGMRMLLMDTGDVNAAAKSVQDVIDEYMATLN
jgi:ABC-type glycerol-3-phosphate transport system substrate-binding protein